MDANTPLERFDEKYDAYSGAVYRLAMVLGSAGERVYVSLYAPEQG